VFVYPHGVLPGDDFVTEQRSRIGAFVVGCKSEQDLERERTVYINHLPDSITKDELYKLFSEHGPIDRCNIMRKRHSGRVCVCADGCSVRDTVLRGRWGMTGICVCGIQRDEGRTCVCGCY